MAGRGVHFAIDAEQAKRLSEAGDDDELLEIVEEIEEAWDLAFETDKAWDVLHRCFSGGTLESGRGDPPLHRVFFGGRTLNENADSFVVLLTPQEVVEVAGALAKVTEDWLRSRYFDVPFPGYQDNESNDDWEYSLRCFQGLPAFFARAASEGRHVIFTVDQ